MSQETNILKIPVQMLAESEGIIARNVVTPDGTVILPAGVEIALFESAIDVLIRRMIDMGIEWVYINAPQQLSEEEIESIIERVYSDDGAIISKERARDVVKHVDTVFTNLREEDEIKPEMVTALSNLGSDLTKDLLKNPSVAFSLGKVLDADEYTFVHSFNVAVLSGYLANRLYPGKAAMLEKIVLGSLMHDIGKAGIPLSVLNKPGPLNSHEFREMKRHPVLGVKMAIQAGVNDEDILSVIGGHHEKWSGSGYPKGKSGNTIAEPARIAAVSDVFDALTARRVYKEPMSSRNAITMILKDAGIHFDPRIAREMLVSIGLYPPGSLVALSSGQVGIVVSGGGKDLVRPIVMIKPPKNDDTTGLHFIDLKHSTNVGIAKYLGHSEKRNLDLPDYVHGGVVAKTA